jgi:hypothetical protein
MWLPQPSVPVPYVSGTITIPAGKAVGVLQLIHEQINPHCPGTSVEFRISADPSNVSPIFIGQIMGNQPLSCTNYGAMLTPMGGERRYRAVYPGTGTPQGMMQVFAEAQAKAHVEVNT